MEYLVQTYLYKNKLKGSRRLFYYVITEVWSLESYLD